MLSHESRKRVYARFCGLSDDNLMGLHFFDANFGSDFDGEFKVKLDDHKSFDDIKDCVIALLMTYKVYDELPSGANPRPSGAKENDINHDFIGLLVKIKKNMINDINKPENLTGFEDDEKKFYKKMWSSRDHFSSCLPFVDPQADIFVASGTIAPLAAPPSEIPRSMKYSHIMGGALNKSSPDDKTSGKLETFFDSNFYVRAEESESFVINSTFIKLYMSAQSKKSKQPTKLDDLTFFQDKPKDTRKQDVYRNKEGKLTNSETDEEVKPGPECAALGEDFNDDSESCGSLMLCLNSGKPELVAQCLNSAEKYEDAFKKAGKDIKEIKNAPRVAVKILEKFGVKAEQYEMPNGQKVVVPVTKNRWFSSLTPEAQKVLNESSYLKEYINALIDHIRANPALTNKNYTGNDVVNTRQSFVEAVGASLFKLPKSNNDLKLATALVLNNMPVVLANHGSAYGLVGGGGGCGSNVRMSYGGMEPNVSMSGGCMSGGGVTFECANTYRLEFKKLKAALRSVGISIDNDGENQVEESLKKIDTFQKSFARVHEVISYLVSLRLSLGLNHYTGPHKVIKLEDITNIEDLNDFSYNTVQELQSYLQNNEVGQVRAMNDLQGFFANLFNKNNGMRKLPYHPTLPSGSPAVSLGQNM